MAIKQRLLKSIRYAMELLETCDTAVLPKVVASLEDADSLLHVGLPSDCHAQYKEIIDGVGSSLHHANTNDLQEIFLLSKDLLIFAEKQITEETHFKREIVFLPYSASMWDSMESVWQAADADKDHAIAYVVPIPYFDRNPDGSIKEWHCDAGKFPHYVPIRDYRSVNLEEMHPDVIVIHSPYDDTNIVTSVHPDYYSRNLKSYTDKLVYIPYFVLEEVDPKDGEALGSISHFVLTPGVYNSDVTIVQSEDMRKAYVEILTQLSEVKDRSYWEKRILGLGSPKIDKVLSTKRENVKLPESWRRIIEKPNGTRKKVIFYNVSLASLLEHEDKLLDKMEWVLSVFRERQNEVALLWRPHPLFVSTLESMKPELLARYRNMVERYRSENWGIYDDTPELHRSIAISDAYYGDASSLVHLCETMGKIIVRQVLDPDGISFKPGAYWFTGYKIDLQARRVWFKPATVNGIFLLHLEQCYANVLSIWGKNFFADSSFGKYEYTLIEKIESFIVCCPTYANDLILIDVLTGAIQKKPLRRFQDKNDELYGYAKFCGCIVYNEKLFLWGKQRAIVEYDWKKDVVRYHTGCFSRFPDQLNYAFSYCNASCLHKNMLLIPREDKNQILCFHLNEMSLDAISINVPASGFHQVESDGTNIWITPREPCVIQYDIDTGVVRVYSFDEEENTHEILPYFSHCACLQDHMLLFPCIGHPKSKSIFCLNGKRKKCYYVGKGYSMVTKVTGSIVAAVDLENMVVDLYNKEGENIDNIKVRFSRDMLDKWVARPGTSFYETELCLTDFFKRLRTEQFARSLDTGHGRLGNEIYRVMMHNET